MRPIELERYEADVVNYSSGSDLKYGNYILAAPIDKGPELYAYAKVRRGPILNVVFHGAVRPNADTYPRFDRVGSLGGGGTSLISFADPTLMISEDIDLGWYLGNSVWDPLDTIVDVIRSVIRVSGAVEVNLVGGSGGGFAALRVGAALDDCLVFVFNPQTVIANYTRKVVDKYFAAAFPDVEQEEQLRVEAARFDMRLPYSDGVGSRRVYYLQHLGDGSHVVGHYRPFKRRLGVTSVDGCDENGLVKHVLVDSERDGHGPPLPKDFEWHFEQAKLWCWGSSR
ncbi:hypothetical protein [Arthrobacter sp. D5-1]|uniref:hypothetical protein n=1 Tax=Arthrobacter sp. D5-1 TaxID=1477518 RepID=UPI001A98FAA5|nr:hypothetical protein [Arthrobacter sp. D5-1]